MKRGKELRCMQRKTFSCYLYTGDTKRLTLFLKKSQARFHRVFINKPARTTYITHIKSIQEIVVGKVVVVNWSGRVSIMSEEKFEEIFKIIE